MVGERCMACNRVRGYRKARPEETLNGRFHRLFELKDCAACGTATATHTWAVWWEMPLA
jgi:hypothetical protein